MSAPTLGLPDSAKLFTLYVTGKGKVALGVLSGLWGHGTDQGLISNQMDSVATGWLGCLRAVAAVALLVREATELTLGGDLFVKVLNEVNTLL